MWFMDILSELWVKPFGGEWGEGEAERVVNEQGAVLFALFGAL